MKFNHKLHSLHLIHGGMSHLMGIDQVLREGHRFPGVLLRPSKRKLWESISCPVIYGWPHVHSYSLFLWAQPAGGSRRGISLLCVSASHQLAPSPTAVPSVTSERPPCLQMRVVCKERAATLCSLFRCLRSHRSIFISLWIKSRSMQLDNRLFLAFFAVLRPRIVGAQ